MKNQYFGDVKDLFKYDLVQHLIEHIPSLRRFTFVTMLTENDERSDGLKLDYRGRAGCENQELVDLLCRCVREGRRNVSEVLPYFEARGIHTDIYGSDKYFTRHSRAQYFADIENELLNNALIVVDPDNGLGGKHPNHRHVLTGELSDLYNRMSADSILMLFQHFRREKHQLTIDKVSKELKTITGRVPIYIYDSEVVFFFLTKDRELDAEISDLLGEYLGRYPKLEAQE
jgi:hypothetical protein